MVTLRAPAGFASSHVIDSLGVKVAVPASGNITVDPAQVRIHDLIAAGFSEVPGGSGATGSRPTAQLYPGQFYFDTSLNKPVWRNAANSGWVDATGTAA